VKRNEKRLAVGKACQATKLPLCWVPLTQPDRLSFLLLGFSAFLPSCLSISQGDSFSSTIFATGGGGATPFPFLLLFHVADFALFADSSTAIHFISIALLQKKKNHLCVCVCECVFVCCTSGSCCSWTVIRPGCAFLPSFASALCMLLANLM